MSEGTSNSHSRPKWRWTLGGLMLVIAGCAVLMGLTVGKIREAERRRLAVEHAWAIANYRLARDAFDEIRKAPPEPRAFPIPLAEPRTTEIVR